MKVIRLFCILLLAVACSHQGASNLTNNYKSIESYNVTDKNGKYLLERDSGLNPQKQLVLKQKTAQANDGKVIEQSVVISTPGRLKKSIPLLRPYRSQYSIWFEGKKYFTETRLDTGKKGLLVKMNSPEKEWNGEKFFELPHGTGAFCYFTQLLECIRFSTFLTQAIDKTSGVMNLHIIWEGYPFFQQQFPDIAEEPISAATFEYDGRNENGEHRFSLKFQGQSIFYLLNDKLSLTKMLWVSQGLSQIRTKH